MARQESEKSTLIREIFRQPVRKFPRRHVVVKGLNDLLQLDLVDLRKLSRWNDGLKYLLVGINCFSKFAFVEALEDKRAATVRVATRKILDDSRNLIQSEINHVMTDVGSEFRTEFQNELRRRNIHGYFAHNKLKASIVERFNRTLKLNLFKAMAIHATRRYIDLLPRVLHRYNYVSKHRTIKRTPFEASQWENEDNLKPIYNKIRQRVLSRYQLNNLVRIVEDKNIFSRGWDATFTPSLYRIVAINRKFPVTYKVADYRNRVLPRAYYEQELLRTTVPDYFLVEKILQRRGDRVYVKWAGYDNDANSWIRVQDFLEDIE